MTTMMVVKEEDPPGEVDQEEVVLHLLEEDPHLEEDLAEEDRHPEEEDPCQEEAILCPDRKDPLAHEDLKDQSDLKGQLEDIPTGDGDHSTALEYFSDIQELASMGSSIPEQLPASLGKCLKPGTSIRFWYSSLSTGICEWASQHYTHYIFIVKEIFLRDRWVWEQNEYFPEMRFREKNHEYEKPRDFIQRQLLFVCMLALAELESQAEVEMVFRTAPVAWKSIISYSQIRDAVDLQLTVANHEDALIDAVCTKAKNQYINCQPTDEDLLYNTTFTHVVNQAIVHLYDSGAPTEELPSPSHAYQVHMEEVLDKDYLKPPKPPPSRDCILEQIEEHHLNPIINKQEDEFSLPPPPDPEEYLRLDSCVDVSLVSQEFYDSLRFKPRLRQGLKMKLYQLTEKDTSLSGYMVLPVYVVTESGRTVELEVEAYVVPGMTVPVLLGEDFHINYELTVSRNVEEGTFVHFGSEPDQVRAIGVRRMHDHN
ncbi:hypothetical protein JAAARDRAFT_50157 [Jaapia argillacea MUCL 33604]|uniref:Uncharacterized protein n=1 Tax=Jaapia argillacea MUCL 33604 TaxID=933084 RepID=A0A067PD79_9AGAM|nr:hypothetical protein JAAARDRAFT_50157 [Jaapia argillacea MUCL 33604]